MNEGKEPSKTGNVSVDKNTAEVTFGDKKHTIHRLKAGKFYKALQVYMDMIKEVAPDTTVEGKSEETVDFDKLIVSMFKNWPLKMVEFITVCCSTVDTKDPITEESIKKDAYPEQITDAFRICLKLNKVAENLKNFVAPIGELGAEMGTVKK